MPQVAVVAALTVAQIVISRLLAGKKPDVGPRQTESKILVVDSVAPRQKIYGHFITAGSIVAARSHPPGDRDHFTYVTALADHTSEGMTHVWIDKDRLEIGVDLKANGEIYDSGTAQGGTQRIEEPYDPENNQFGNQPGYITLRAGASATDNAYAGLTVEITGGKGIGQSETIESYDGSLKRAYIAGFWGTVPDGTSTYEVKVEISGWEDWLIPVKDTAKGDKYIVNGEPLIGFKIYLGDQSAADTRLVNIDPGNWWGTDYIGENITYAGVTWKTDAELGFGARMPEIQFEGDFANDIYDWRTATTGYTNNAVLCLADWLLWEFGPFQRLNASWAAVGIDETDFVSAEMIAEANIADEAVTLKDGVTTQPRYTADGIVAADDNPEDIFQKFFLVLGGGMLVRRGAQMFVRAGADRSPVMALTEKSIGYSSNHGIVTRPRHSARERFNTVEGEYHDARPGQAFERTTYPAVSLAGFLTADGGRRKRATIDFELSSNHERSQRLARIQLVRHRQERTVTAPFLFTAGEPPGPWRLEVGDVVTLDRPEYGGASEFWVQHSRGLGDGLTELTLREHTDFWLEAPEDADDVEEADQADLWDGRIDDPTGLSASFVAGSESVRPDGRFTVSMELTVDPHPNSIVRRLGVYRFRLRHITDTQWRGGGTDDPAKIFPNLVIGERYQAQVIAAVATGSASAKSLWSPRPPFEFVANTAEIELEGPPGTGSTGENRVPNPNFNLGGRGWQVL